jgi:hypothetical protein
VWHKEREEGLVMGRGVGGIRDYYELLI